MKHALWIDVTRPVSPDMPLWPGDPDYKIERIAAICKKLVELHDGKIGVKNNESTPGACFWFTLKRPDLSPDD